MKRFRALLILPLLAWLALPALGQGVNFGLASAIGDNEVLVGQPQNQGAPGALFIFHRNLDGTGWTEDAKLTASNGAPSDAFGGAIAINGATLLVGAPGYESGQGAAYIFERDAASGGWTERAQLTAGEGETANLGNAVALSGKLAAVGAPAHNEQTGTVYVYRRTGSGMWEETSMLAPTDLQTGDRFGSALTFAGERIFVGSTRQNDTAGAVYVFRHNATTEMWDQEAKLENTDEALKSFGASILVRDDMAFIGAPGVTPGAGQSGGTPVPGAVVAFQFDAASATWTSKATLKAANPAPMDLFGLSLADAGEQLLIGTPGASQFSGGVRAYAYDTASESWTAAESLSPDDQGLLIFGVSMASRGSVSVIGMPGADFGEGNALIYERDAETGAWTARATLSSKASGLNAITGNQVNCANGAADQFDCKEVDLMAFIPVQELGGGRGVKLNDIWGWTDSQTGKEYALVGRMDGTSFVDISDPHNPIYLGDLPLTEGANSSAWRDMKVYDNHIFIVADNAGAHGMQVFDLTQLRNVSNPPATFEETAHYNGLFSAHNIVINEDTGFAYAVGSSGGGETCGGGLHMIDVREPHNPIFAGCFADTETGKNRTGYSHDAQCVIYAGPDAEHRGKEVCFGANETALSIADVSDKENTVPLSQAAYPNVGYAHQGWLTDDHRHFFMNDELDELSGKVDGTRTLVWDVTDLDDPQLVREYISDNKASDHNLYIKGNLMYQSNYLSGLRIFDISDIENPAEVGYFDTVPYGDNAPGFGGSWSNYPYFKSGAIIVTSMGEGLFVLKKRAVDI